MGKLLSENDVKKALGVEDFRSLSKDKVIEFVSQIPNMEKDLAMKMLEQYPVFAGNSRDIVGYLKNLCELALEKNESSQKEAILGYQKVLDSLAKSLEDNELSEDERRELRILMIQVADKISSKDTEGKKFIGAIVDKLTFASVGAVVLGAVMIGVRITGKSKS